jgi:hypothetical protein
VSERTKRDKKYWHPVMTARSVIIGCIKLTLNPKSNRSPMNGMTPMQVSIA